MNIVVISFHIYWNEYILIVYNDFFQRQRENISNYHFIIAFYFKAILDAIPLEISSLFFFYCFV